jgi:hypothetical protein
VGYASLSIGHEMKCGEANGAKIEISDIKTGTTSGAPP